MSSSMDKFRHTLSLKQVQLSKHLLYEGCSHGYQLTTKLIF